MENIFESHKRMIEMAAKDLAQRAARLGIVLTVEQIPANPPTAGGFVAIVSVRPDEANRKKAELAAKGAAE